MKQRILLEIQPSSKPILTGKAWLLKDDRLESLGDFALELANDSQKNLVSNLYNTIRNKIHKATVGKGFCIWRRQKLLPGLQIRNEVGDYLI